MIDSKLQGILAKYADDVKRVVVDGDDLMYYDDLYEELFSHFCNSGEIPYGVAKGRTGDPYAWITNYLNNCYPN